MSRAPKAPRWPLWGALLLLVGALLAVLVFLAAEYEVGRDQAALDQDATTVVGEIRSALLRNVQTLQSLNAFSPTPASWDAPAAELLAQRRELVRLEWRDTDMRVLAQRLSAYRPDVFDLLPRGQALPEVRQACDAALRLSGPAYSASYFWPKRDGRGLEVMELCLPLSEAGESRGFLIATYSLPAMLAELTDAASLRGRGLSFVESDGARLAVHSVVPVQRRTLSAHALLDLPGHTLLLQLESPRRALGLFPNVLTGVVGALSLALLAVLVLLARDMRRRQHAEQRAADALAFRKAMEDSLVTGLRARDMTGRITYVNPAFCQMVGLTAEQLVGSGMPAPWWPPELVDEYQQRQAVRLAGQILPREGYESVFQRSDGTRFPVLIIEAPLIDAQGVQTGYMSAIIDLTEQRRIEELNRASQDKLQATARLATVGEMASLISHELNQPLAAIASYASGTLNLLQRGEDRGDDSVGGDIERAIRRIGEQAERAGRVIRGVADFVRRRDQVREAVEPRLLIEGISTLLTLQAKKRGIRLQVDIAPGTPRVWCDRTMVEQVLLNLARNGMQAMPLGDPGTASGLRVLHIAMAPVMGEAGEPSEGRCARWVRVDVTDHGQGLPPEVAERLFTPFFTTKAEGMGLGLSLCRTVVEQHGGALDFEPAQPRGTRFSFTLPVAEAQAGRPLEAQAALL
ncbi:MAG TPA: ATP-binding protein [Hydrogenophaga sp.]|uniref:two-component system sensor histidine kinase NtrB n=1 Tax=Hydrogenophaga sp. TaxID=1904254 RepID=UPI002B5DFFF2|nr:ATP-binding protein [Hydrogenophaga sp.]HSX95735.1 ATP-binding protein [Hydrogenophaga sp.]